MSRRKNDFMVGLLVIVALVLLLSLTFKVNKFSFFELVVKMGGFETMETNISNSVGKSKEK